MLFRSSERRKTLPAARLPKTCVSKKSDSILPNKKKGIKYIPMEFEFDPVKSETNKQKHGINFEEAKKLWLDEDRVEFPARSETEERRAMIAQKENKIWITFFTIRSQAIRLISVRRARKNEERAYYES
jgi:uncharacterized DUF497 family protein